MILTIICFNCLDGEKFLNNDLGNNGNLENTGSILFFSVVLISNYKVL